jgi:L-lactate dehydrogenase complex protein LldG
MFELFKAKAEAVSAEVHRFATSAGALDFITETLQKEGVADAPSSWAVWCEGPLRREAERARLPDRVPGLHFDVTRDRAAGSKVGVSEFDWAIADTGTLAQDATRPEKRLVSTLTETHLAVVRTGSLLPDFSALLARVDPSRMRYLACVTGPSRTADIERVLTIGVHGPRRLVVVAIDEEGRVDA